MYKTIMENVSFCYCTTATWLTLCFSAVFPMCLFVCVWLGRWVSVFISSIFFLDGIRQFVVITAIDQLGVPNNDMKNAYSYRCVREYCKKVSVEFGLDLLHVIPVSNYFEEVASNDAKNAMSLFNLWRVFKSGKEYIERRWNKKETRYFKKDRKWTSE